MRVSLDLGELLSDGGGDLRAAVSHIGVPQARGRVEVAIALLIPDPDGIAALDYELVALDGAHIREWVPKPRLLHLSASCGGGGLGVIGPQGLPVGELR